jgi:hypothetical protein
MNLGGYVYDQLGVAISGLTVELWAHDGVAATSSTTTSAAGYWQFTSVATTDTWKIKIINGTKVQWIHGSAEVQVTNLDCVTAMATDTIAEHTAAAGVTVDGCLIKDGVVEGKVKRHIWAQFLMEDEQGTVWGETIYPNNTATYRALTVAIPTGFTTLTKAVIVMIPLATGNLYISSSVNFAANGESYNTHSSGVTIAIKAAVANKVLEYDISSALTGLAAGDYLGVRFDRAGTDPLDTCEGELDVLGLLLEYT